MSIPCDQYRVFPLCACFAVLSARFPVVFGIDDRFANACIDHGFDSEGHARGHGHLALVVMVADLGWFMEFETYAVANELVDDAAAFAKCVVFDHLTDFPKGDPWKIGQTIED